MYKHNNRTKYKTTKTHCKYQKTSKLQKSNNPKTKVQNSEPPKIQKLKIQKTTKNPKFIKSMESCKKAWILGFLDFSILGIWDLWILGSFAFPVLLFDMNAASENEPKSDQQKSRFRIGVYSILKGSACRRGRTMYIYICISYVTTTCVTSSLAAHPACPTPPAGSLAADDVR